MPLNRRQVMGLAAASSLTPLHQAFAQAGYPSKPITLVVRRVGPWTTRDA
jgi:tripartite-type tricarboxylate transporter receptor subunit TctC